jgi:hypothetical protein
MPLLESYLSYDGEAAGAVVLRLEEDGRWAIKNLQGKPLSQGSLDRPKLEEAKKFLSYWQGLAGRRANGWAEPQFGGCTNPITMGAARAGGIEIHFRSERFAEFSDMEMSNRQATVLSLFKKMEGLIPDLTRYV